MNGRPLGTEPRNTRSDPAFGLPASRRHAVRQGASGHEHKVDRRHGDEALPYAHFVLIAKVPHQRSGQWRTHHGSAAKAHDRHAGSTKSKEEDALGRLFLFLKFTICGLKNRI